MKSSTQQPSEAVKSMSLEVWGATDKGREREENEDSIFPHSGTGSVPFEPSSDRIAKRGQLLIVADGVGGAQAGAEASQWAVRAAVERYYDTTVANLGDGLRSAIEATNESLHQYLKSISTGESGCTTTAAVIKDGMLYVANVGDSRAYLIRNGGITQLTRDHTLTQQKVDLGLIQPEQAELDPNRNVLTRSMGAGPEVTVDLFPPLKLAKGDVILLCSDGLTDMLSDQEISRIASGTSPRWAAQQLIVAANQRGGFDNISVVIARVGGGPSGGAVPPLFGLRRLSTGQKIVLSVLAGMVSLLLCASLGVVGWLAYGKRDDSSTTTPPATYTVPVPTATEEPGGDSGLPTPDEEEMTPRSTSTPVPTSTPTPFIIPVLDSDGDGLNDNVDRCPDVSGPVVLDGCPDGDGDGVPNIDDQCLDLLGPPELDGCPDEDGDGIPHYLDACPYDEGPVENNGCPVADDGGGGE